MPALCEKCKQVVNSHDKQVVCDCCRVVFHLTEDCTGMSTSEQRAIVLQKRCLLYFCGECRDAFKATPLIMRKVQELQEEVKILKQELQALKVTPRHASENIEQILSESHERFVRANNIMVYGASESPANDIQEKIMHDKNIAYQIFEKVGYQSKVANILKVTRVGKKGGDIPRPLKVICNNSETVKAILLSKRKLDHNFCKIGYDSTKMQQAAYKAARIELIRRRDGGEDNLVIKFIKGIPTIINKKQHKRHQEN